MKQLLISAALASLLVVAAPLQAACNAKMSQTKPDSALRDNGDGTISDRETGLMWMQCPLGLSDPACATGTVDDYTWKEALEAAQAANAGAGTNGYSDWRLPSVAELGSIIESACVSPAINEDFFPATPLGFSYWSSSPFRSDASKAWAVNFYSGTETDQAKSTGNYIRLVRN